MWDKLRMPMGKPLKVVLLVEIWFPSISKVDPQIPETISDIKFESYGCASNIATGSIITELAKGKTLEEAKKINWKTASEALGGLPKIKAHCSVLAVEGLRGAIQNYEERHGI